MLIVFHIASSFLLSSAGSSQGFHCTDFLKEALQKSGIHEKIGPTIFLTCVIARKEDYIASAQALRK